MTHLLNNLDLNGKEMPDFLNLFLKKWLYRKAVAILFILVGTCTPSVGAIEDFKGTYSGTYSGTDYGTWTARYVSQGTGVGVAWSNRYNIPDVGTGAINSSGVFYATMNGGSTLTGTVASNGNVQGTWNNPYTGQSGTLSGRKNLPAELKKFEGNYEGTFSGSDSGTWNVAIDSEGNCSGNVWSETDQQNYSGAGIINYTGEFISEVSNRAIQHGIINSAGNVQGTWYIPSGGSGTLTGSKVSAIIKPTVTTGSATALTSSTATLNGTVNPNGANTTYYFQYGTTAIYGLTTSSTSAGSGTTNVSASASLTGLSSNITHHFRLVGTNSAGTNYGNDQTFATSGSAPTVTTGSATSLSMSSATLNGTVNPNGSSTSYYFEYGTSISYNMTTTSTNAGSGTSTVSVGVPVTGLISCTTYHFRVRASNNAGTSYGDDQTFTTTCPSKPTVTTNWPTSVTTSSATVNGRVNPNGESTSYYFEYGLTTAYGSATPEGSAGAGSSEVLVSSDLSGLAQDTTYHYRVVGTNSEGTAFGDDKTFSTVILYVDSSGSCGGNIPCYLTIQEAVDAATSGATIKIAEGIYDEVLILETSNNLTLQGGWDSTFTTQSSNTTINSLTISSGALTIDSMVIQ